MGSAMSGPAGARGAGPASTGAAAAGTIGIGSVRCRSASADCHPGGRCHSSPATRHTLNACCHTDVPPAPPFPRLAPERRADLPSPRRFPFSGADAELGFG